MVMLPPVLLDSQQRGSIIKGTDSAAEIQQVWARLNKCVFVPKYSHIAVWQSHLVLSSLNTKDNDIDTAT